jgi:hypothetical protein
MKESYLKVHVKRCPRGMLPWHLLSMPKKKNKVKVNVEKMFFYNFKALNAQITIKNFFISKFNYNTV